MKNIGCFGFLVLILALGFLAEIAKNPVGGPILLVTVIAAIATTVYLFAKATGKHSDDFLPSGSRVKSVRTQEERRSDFLLELGNSLPKSGISIVALKPGEEFIYKLSSVSLIESLSNGSTYQGGSKGVSLRIAKGLSYRVGATKGQFVKNPETLQTVDRGTATFTNKRLIFAGTKANREWSFDKLIDVSQSSDGDTILLSVSNRQKPSGIVSNNLGELDPGVIVAIALEFNNYGIDAAKKRCFHEAGVSSSYVEKILPKTINESTDETTAAEHKAIEEKSSMGKTFARIDLGDDAVDVVGESFYAESFEALRKRHNLEYGETENFEVDLVAEPFNSFSENGHAVSVQLDGLVLGYISEDENTEFFELLKQTNGRAKCEGEIYFAPISEIMKNSVVLFCDFPPSLQGPERVRGHQ